MIQFTRDLERNLILPTIYQVLGCIAYLTEGKLRKLRAENRSTLFCNVIFGLELDCLPLFKVLFCRSVRYIIVCIGGISHLILPIFKHPE